MRKFLPILTFFLVILFSPSKTFSQDTTTFYDFYDKIKNYDLSTIWFGDSIEVDNLDFPSKKMERPAPLGYIDTNYTRFDIHFISVTKNQKNPYEYNIIGKTRVKNNVCSFQGTIKILASVIGQYDDFPNYKAGNVICEILFYENKSQASSGLIKGQLTTQFTIDEKGRLKYDALMLVADSYSNNEFEGTWTSYKTKKSKKCNWGDFRIPESGDLDVGVGEFFPADKYLKNGWGNYRLTMNPTDPIKPEVQKAIEIENLHWWE